MIKKPDALLVARSPREAMAYAEEHDWVLVNRIQCQWKDANNKLVELVVSEHGLMGRDRGMIAYLGQGWDGVTSMGNILYRGLLPETLAGLQAAVQA